MHREPGFEIGHFIGTQRPGRFSKPLLRPSFANNASAAKPTPSAQMKGLVWRAILTTTSRLLLALFSVALADADISPGICPERDEVGDTISKIEANVNGPGTVVCKYNGNVICAYFADGNLDTENSENSDLCHPHTKQPSTTTEATRTSCSISPTTPPASIGPVSTQSIASTFTTSIATSAEGSSSRTSIAPASSTHPSTGSTSAQSNPRNERVAEIVGLSIGLPVFCALLGLFFVFRRRRGRAKQVIPYLEPEADVASSPRQRRTEKFRQVLGIGQSGSERERLDSERQTHPRGQTLTGRVHMIEARLDALAERLPDAAPPIYGT